MDLKEVFERLSKIEESQTNLLVQVGVIREKIFSLEKEVEELKNLKEEFSNLAISLKTEVNRLQIIMIVSLLLFMSVIFRADLTKVITAIVSP